MHLNAQDNEYRQLILSEVFDKTPKAVLGAVLVSFVRRLDPELETPAQFTAAILEEWTALINAGIIPSKQKPPKFICSLSELAPNLGAVLERRRT